MEKKEINRSFINETFIKKYTSFMNHSAELFEYFSTLVEQKQKENNCFVSLLILFPSFIIIYLCI